MASKVKKSKKKSRVHNLVRGVASYLKAPSTPVAHRDRWRQEQKAHQQINEAISLAKHAGTPDELARFGDWVVRASGGIGLGANKVGTPLTSLGLFPATIEATTLAGEVALAITRLKHLEPQLSEFCSCIREFEASFLVRDWNGALAVLDRAAKNFGNSYWDIEARLATIQASAGLEALKAAVSTFSNGASNANRYLFHNFGVRNEHAQAPGRFKEILRKRIDESVIDEGLKIYLRYRLFGDLDFDEKHLAYVLAAEQFATGIDLLLTAIKLISWFDQNSSNYSKAAQQAISELAGAIRHLSEGIGIARSLDQEQTVISDASVQTTSQIATHAVRRLLQTDGAPTNPHVAPSAIEAIVEGLLSKLSTRSDGVAAEDLLKLELNFNCVPTVMRLSGVERAGPFPTLFVEALEHDGQQASKPPNIRQALVRAMLDYVSVESEGADSSYLVQLRNEFRSGNRATAIPVLEHAIRGCHNEIVVDGLLVIKAQLQSEFGESVDCLETCVLAGLRNENLVPLLPLDVLFQGAKWVTVKKLGPSPALPICLDLYLRIFDDRKVRTYKRFAIEELLSQYACRSLPELLKVLASQGVAIGELEYLFRESCDIYTMELLPGMGNSREVLAQRAELFRQLAALCPANEDQYLSEATEIDETLSVSDGLDRLDDSRVYVDEPRVLNLVNKQLSADFQRYRNLVAAGIGVPESLADVVREMNNPTSKTFQVPKNDADDLLADITYQIRDRFLFDPAYGLDIHLSRRIRHGTIASQIRAPLDAAGLIGQRPKVGGSYEPPERVVKMSATLDRKVRMRMYAAFARFAESIDQHIALLRDEYFHVYSPMKPRGAFELTISPALLTLIRGVAQTCKDIQEFSRECVAVFWLALTQRLPAGQRHLELESKKALKAIFDKLTQELRSIGGAEMTLAAMVQQTSEEVRNRVSTIASWVHVPNTSAETKTYSMRQIVDISVAVMTSQRPGFKPVVNAEVPADLALDTYGLSVVSDMLYIALGNVCEHSGKKVDARVDIEIGFDKEESLISFSLVNEVEKGVRTPEREASLQSTRAKIHKRSFGEGARSEGKSGLLKLAALVLQSDNADIKFGFVDDTHFSLNFTMDYVSANRDSSATAESNVILRSDEREA